MVLRTDIIPREIVEAVIEETHKHDEKTALLIAILFYSSARISEILGNRPHLEAEPDPLIPSRVFQDRGIILIRNLKSKRHRKICKQCQTTLKSTQKTCFCGNREIDIKILPKRWKEPLLPVNIIEWLQEYIKKNNIQPNESIFAVGPIQGYRIVRRAFELAGIDQVGLKHPHPHNMRHSFVGQGVRAKADLKFLQSQTGHQNIAMLGQYMEALDENKPKEMNKMWKRGNNTDEERNKAS